MSVDDSRGLFHCFACHAGGDVVGFVEQIEGVTRMQALSSLARELGISFDAASASPTPQRTPAEALLLRIHAEAAELYSQALALPAAKPCAQALQERGVNSRAAAIFRLGFAPGGDWLTQRLRQRGYTPEQLEKARLAMPSDGRLKDRRAGGRESYVCQCTARRLIHAPFLHVATPRSAGLTTREGPRRASCNRHA